MKLISLTSTLLSAIAVLVMVASSISTYAQTAPSTISSTSSKFDIDLTVCKKVFDWNTFLDDINANVTTTNPYNPQVCGPSNTIRLTNIISNGFTRYNQGQITTPAANQLFGNDPILGIWDNASNPAQKLGTGSPAVTQRNSANALSNIFTSEQLSQIYSTGGARTGMPRTFSTSYQDANNDGTNDADRYDNINKFISKSTNNRVNFGTCATQVNGVFQFDANKCTKQTATLSECITNNKFDRTLCEGTYAGGFCEVVNGQIRVRTKRAGYDYDVPSDRNASTPLTSCARTINGTRQNQVEDQNLQLYQFVYEFNYPTQAQCSRIPPSGVDYNSCLEYYQTQFGKNLAGNDNLTSGTRTMSVFTFYGAFDDKYSRWVGWRNPDVDTDARNNSTDPLIRSYRGFSVYEF